ncbi:hypothetical protein BPOR_1175g00020 [Botrytis porri]|uniref:Uncharacterized protein n=1 Tax=Botrytis porri TaxID=87229 RepID=A0A4Z1KCY8_9HELO|nr:hypothetical protein BPOR_1175g00020 [Botrytis porri]
MGPLNPRKSEGRRTVIRNSKFVVPVAFVVFDKKPTKFLLKESGLVASSSWNNINRSCPYKPITDPEISRWIGNANMNIES